VNASGIYGVKGTPGILNTPGARHSSSSWVACDHQFWVFGGFGPSGRHNDLWTFNPDTEEWTWKHGSNLVGQPGVYGTKGVSAPANTPGARQGAVCWTEGCEIWLFGGTTDGGVTFHNDLWRYSIYGGEWTWMGGSNTTNGLGTYGTKGTGNVNNIPGARRDAVGWVTPNKLWLFGGHGFPGSGTVEDDLNDLWSYEVSTGKWTWVNGSNTLDSPGVYSAGSASTPGARSASSSWTTADGKLWLCGGLIGATANILTYGPQMNDIWTYDPSTDLWSYRSGSQSGGAIGTYGSLGAKDANNHPSGRWTVGTMTSLNGDQWFFGGGGLDGFGSFGRNSDLWNYGITMPVGTPPAPPSTPFPDSLILNAAPTANNAAAATMASVPVNGQVAGKDADGDIIQFSTTGTTLSHGTLTLQSNGQWTYLPAPGFVGTDTFTFKASDYYGGQSPTRTLTITVTTNPADADNDGIPDSYEQSTFGSTGADALGDADGDGQSNYFEYLAGTNPINAGQSLTTAPTIAAGGGSNGGNFKLDLSHVRPGVSYHLETSSDMEVWNRIGTFTFSVSGSATIEDPTAPTSQPAFYRISLEAASGLVP
jgi:VCBS repeat-containing protein